VLKLDSGYYGYGNGNATKFSRLLYISNALGGGKDVLSIVSWDGTDVFSIPDCNTAHKCLYTKDTLTDWAQ
jgi:hypothetical protein